MSTAPAATATLPRGLVIARAWADLGDAVAPLSGGAGRPLTRTVKLILDPLVLRPVLNPEFAAGAVAIEHVDALRARIIGAGPVLAATAAWFVVLKKERRRLRITDGNPQDLYFQRCYELATEYGLPGGDAARTAAEVLADVHAQDGPSISALRDYLRDAATAGELTRLLESAWATPAAPSTPPVIPSSTPSSAPESAGTAEFLDSCATAPDRAAFATLVAAAAGTAGAGDLGRPGVAMAHGLSDRDRPVRPVLGESASKGNLPKPFDRSIVERLFAPLTNTFLRTGLPAVPALVRQEISRSAGPWQLADEVSRVVMVLGRDASAGLTGAPPSGGAAVRLRSRWEREAYVHRVLRMPASALPALHADVRGVRAAYLRRLWVRVHGRELRGDNVSSDQVWDVLDGVLRSVILDQRDRLRSALERGAEA